MNLGRFFFSSEIDRSFKVGNDWSHIRQRTAIFRTNRGQMVTSSERRRLEIGQ